MEQLSLEVFFTGGLELLFNKQKSLQLSVPNGSDLRKLIQILKKNHLKEREELFSSGDDIRPGILIVVNDVDSELLGHLDYKLKEKDQILFISTLHGG